MEIGVLTILVIVFAIFYDIANGWNDSANAIATVVSTRVMRPRTAIIFGAVLNFAGAMFSSEVANTVGKDIADPTLLGPATFLAAVVISPIWIAYCTWRGLPISCSHSLMGGLVGAVIATTGVEGLKSDGIQKIVFGIFTSPIIGFFLGLIIIVIIYNIFRNWRPSTITKVFGRLQLLSAGAMAFSHGTGDAQKAMGIITGSMISAKLLELGADGKMCIPLWVRLVCAGAIALGTAWGGWRVMKTLGSRLANLKPVHGFAAETAASITILANTLTGVPISTTHSITGAIVGVGAAKGLRSIKWAVGGKIVFAWLVTFPICIGGGALIFEIFKLTGIAAK
jgi:PiT family inorganic phosphate transporter